MTHTQKHIQIQISSRETAVIKKKLKTLKNDIKKEECETRREDV